MKLQLCMIDEYGSTSILGSGTDAGKLIKAAKDAVHELNINNALSAAEKKRNWEAMYIELIDPNTGEQIEDAVYGGKDSTGQHAVTPLAEDTKSLKLANCDVKVRAWLGVLDGKTLYAETERGVVIEDIKSPALNGKQVYYLKKI